jgi:protein-S-isoprenylcysteine O-methyltransferase Ste14
MNRSTCFVVGQFALLGLIFLLPNTAPRASGVVLMVLQIPAWGFLLAGALALGRNLTPMPTPRQNATLQTTGVYGVVRHPIYSGLLLLTLLETLARGTLLAWGLFVALALLLELKSRFEEEQLRQVFPDYSAYQARVKKFVPFVY